MMKKRLILFLVATFGLGLLSGCFHTNPDEGTVPWASPASWEGQGPNMPDVPGQYDHH